MSPKRVCRVWRLYLMTIVWTENQTEPMHYINRNPYYIATKLNTPPQTKRSSEL
jgi:hypothetical protein